FFTCIQFDVSGAVIALNAFCSQCKICPVSGANGGQFLNYFISISAFPGQDIFPIFIGVIR
ncbi:TPA: hypothetical protein ACV71G_005461, partial [Escherichia coli]